MGELIERTSTRALALLLVTGYMVFYIVQISVVTSNPDPMVFSCRALSDLPITHYAYLNAGPHPLPNYHLLHTVLLWAIYHICPAGLAHTLWPSEFLSAICGALAIGLTFLIWLRLGFTKTIALTAAIIAGIIPNCWDMSLSGEPFMLQQAFTLLFLYLFLGGRTVFATLAFLATVLVAPIGGMSFVLVLFASRTRSTLFRALKVGGAALTLYALIFYFLKINVLDAFSAVASDQHASLLWKSSKLFVFLVLNTCFLIPFLFRGFKIIASKFGNLVFPLCLALCPVIVLDILNFQFLSFDDGFHLLLFWSLCLPIAWGITEAAHQRRRIFLSIAGTIALYVVFWMAPNTANGLARAEAGYQLREISPKEIKMAGPWREVVPIALAKYGWSLQALETKCVWIDVMNSDAAPLRQTGEKSLLIVKPKQNNIRSRMAALGLKYKINDNDFDPQKVKIGTARKIFENDVVNIFKWDGDSIVR